MCVTVSVREFPLVHACFHVYTILYAQLACVRACSSCSQQAERAGSCYVQLWCIKASSGACSALLKALWKPMYNTVLY